MKADYDYASKPLTAERREEIAQVIDGLRNDAIHDIEDKRDIYEALVDLFNARDIGDWS